MRGDWEYKVGDVIARIGDALDIYVVAERGSSAYYVRTKRISTEKFIGTAVFDKYEVEDGPFIRVDDIDET